MKKFLTLFRKVGGMGIVKEYARANALHYLCIQILTQGFSKKSLEIARLSTDNLILKRLRKKNKKFIAEFLSDESNLNKQKVAPSKIWVCWFQGMESAPEVVKVCYDSICRNIKDREVILLTDKNWEKFVEFPSYIQDKIERGIISKTHMSDLLRLELLTKYGGTWIDATVFCSGKKIPDYMLNSDLFLFQNLKPGLDGQSTRISNWFITSCSNNPMLSLTLNLLYNYWFHYDYIIHYYIFHDFFELAIEAFPEEWNKVVPFSNSTPHILLLRLFDNFDSKVWDSTLQMTPFHKLSYKFRNEEFLLEETYYKNIISQME
ncbi:capsular polysaccharide synthesis protein [Streptococcus suis]